MVTIANQIQDNFKALNHQAFLNSLSNHCPRVEANGESRQALWFLTTVAKELIDILDSISEFIDDWFVNKDRRPDALETTNSLYRSLFTARLNLDTATKILAGANYTGSDEDRELLNLYDDIYNKLNTFANSNFFLDGEEEQEIIKCNESRANTNRLFKDFWSRARVSSKIAFQESDDGEIFTESSEKFPLTEQQKLELENIFGYMASYLFASFSDDTGRDFTVPNLHIRLRLPLYPDNSHNLRFELKLPTTSKAVKVPRLPDDEATTGARTTVNDITNSLTLQLQSQINDFYDLRLRPSVNGHSQNLYLDCDVALELI